MIKIFRLRGPGVARSITASIALLALSACGGGDSPPQQSMMDADSAASASVAAFTAFTQDQIVSGSEAAEPRPVQGITPPVSDTTEPVAI